MRVSNGAGTDLFSVESSNGNCDIQGALTAGGREPMSAGAVVSGAAAHILGSNFAITSDGSSDVATIAGSSGNAAIMGTVRRCR